MTLLATFIHLFIPHETNNHRPKVLHIDALLFYVLLFALFHFGIHVLQRKMPDVLGYATDIHVEQLLAATNARRQAAGLSPLTLNNKLSQAAADKAKDMFGKNYWAHNSPDGHTPWDFISGVGYRYTVAGENLAKNFTTSDGVLEAWMASPTHKDNIVKPTYKEIGFAVVNGILAGEETTLVVQMFGASDDPAVVAAVPETLQFVDQALAAEEVPVEVSAPAWAQGVTKQPLIHIPNLTRDVVILFVGVLLGVLVLDAWIVSRRRIIRVAGHNIAHILFLSAVTIAVSSVSRGVLV